MNISQVFGNLSSGSKNIANESASTKKMTKPDGIPDSYRDHLRLLADLLVMAFQVDATRFQHGLCE